MKRIFITFLTFSSIVMAQNGNRKEHTNMESVVPADLIPPAPLLSAADELKTFQIAPGFSINCFAAEPLVEKPVAIEFDEAGRAWVVEMVGYMMDLDGKDEKTPQGRIVVLEDTDHDGKADTRSVFLDKILLPRAVAVYADGILFLDHTSLWWAERDGVQIKGEPKLLDASFSKDGNVEHRPNGLMHNLDNNLYLAKSDKRIRRVDGKFIVEKTSFRGQWGISHDDYGRLYHNNNSVTLFGDAIVPNLLDGNVGFKPEVKTIFTLGSNQCFPARVTPGVNRAYIAKKNGYQENTLDPRTYKLINVTAACGPLVVRSANFPAEWKNRALICESTAQLVKAVQFEEKNGKPSGKNPYDKSEFLTSTDERFRPVNAHNAPDGSVLIVDFYHGIIQDKEYMTTYLRNQYASRGLDKPATGVGRIWRITATNGKPQKYGDLTKLDDGVLANMLAHENSWHRDMAQRVFVDSRSSSDTAVAALEKIAKSSNKSTAQIAAMWTLQGMNHLTADVIATVLKSADAEAVNSALWAATMLSKEELSKLTPTLLSFKGKNERQIGYHARALGALGSAAFPTLIEIIGSNKTSDFIQACLIVGLEKQEKEFILATGDKIKIGKLAQLLDDAANDKTMTLNNGKGLSGDALASYTRGQQASSEAACMGCHGINAEGMDGLGPPLDGSEWVNGKPENLARILLCGLEGAVTVKGKTYNPPVAMPPLSMNPTMTDEKLADIATYIRNQWSNKSGVVSPAIFTKIRKENADRQAGKPYTEKELLEKK